MEKMKKDDFFYLDGKRLIKQAERKYPKPSKTGYNAILVNKDFFFKGTMIKEFRPEIFIQRFKPISVFLGENITAQGTQEIEQMAFRYIGIWDGFLIYREIPEI